MAARKGNVSAFRALLDKSWADHARWIDHDAKDDAGWTALHFAANNGHEEILRRYVEAASPDINERDSKDGLAPIHLAARSNHIGVLKAYEFHT